MKKVSSIQLVHPLSTHKLRKPAEKGSYKETQMKTFLFVTLEENLKYSVIEPNIKNRLIGFCSFRVPKMHVP
jgi:hypothetical protein